MMMMMIVVKPLALRCPRQQLECQAIVSRTRQQNSHLLLCCCCCLQTHTLKQLLLLAKLHIQAALLLTNSHLKLLLRVTYSAASKLHLQAARLLANSHHQVITAAYKIAPSSCSAAAAACKLTPSSCYTAACRVNNALA